MSHQFERYIIMYTNRMCKPAAGGFKPAYIKQEVVSMKWILLTIGIVTEVSSVTSMKLSDGFTKWLPSTLTFVFMGISLAIFILALKRFDLSFAYAIWAGLGIAVVSIIGILYFKEPVTVLKIASIALIAIGVVGLNISDLIYH